MLLCPRVGLPCHLFLAPGCVTGVPVPLLGKFICIWGFLGFSQLSVLKLNKQPRQWPNLSHSRNFHYFVFQKTELAESNTPSTLMQIKIGNMVHKNIHVFAWKNVAVEIFWVLRNGYSTQQDTEGKKSGFK